MPSQPDRSKIFYDPAESSFYSYCLEMLVFKACAPSTKLIEFGSGDGRPVIQALRRSGFPGVIEGFEPNDMAYRMACANIAQAGLGAQYHVLPRAFEAAACSPNAYLIANPPYLPAPHADIRLPFLYGGKDGTDITKRLLECDVEKILLILSSYSCPAEMIAHARERQYVVSHFIVLPARFGYYSTDPVVKKRIRHLHRAQKAFYSEQIYLIAGVLFQRYDGLSGAVNLAREFVQVMTALKGNGEFQASAERELRCP
jgi:hypothetical protein